MYYGSSHALDHTLGHALDHALGHALGQAVGWTSDALGKRESLIWVRRTP